MLGSSEKEKKKQLYIDQSGFATFQFSDMKQENREIHTLGKYDQSLRHRVISPGLSLEGVCEYSECKVFNQLVWVNKGFGAFDISLEIDCCKCPICGSDLPMQKVKSLGYSKANVKVSGRKENQKTRVQWEDAQKEGKLIKYPGYDGKSSRWYYLRVTVTKI